EEHILVSANKEAESIIQRAEEQAQEIINAAEERAQSVVSESELVKAVNEESEKIRDEVKQEAHRIYRIAEQEIQESEREAQRRIKIFMDSCLIEADNIKRQANSYAESVLHELERTVIGTLSIIQNGQKHLKESLSKHITKDNKTRLKEALADVKNIPSEFFDEIIENSALATEEQYNNPNNKYTNTNNP
ncbi:MAG TPA: hypothetical protein V6C96_00035, partial [Vampirovibrionales bacterium]